jgi:hypothetical protein
MLGSEIVRLRWLKRPDEKKKKKKAGENGIEI